MSWAQLPVLGDIHTSKSQGVHVNCLNMQKKAQIAEIGTESAKGRASRGRRRMDGIEKVAPVWVSEGWVQVGWGWEAITDLHVVSGKQPANKLVMLTL